MNAPAHSGWRAHGIALVIAAGMAAAAGSMAGLGHHAPEHLTTQLTYPLYHHHANFQQEPRLAGVLARTLADGSSIVLLGSSELTTADHPAKPVNFFNERLGEPLLALGHEGNQSFSMHAQLLAADTDLTRSRLAILVSPSWFVNRSGRMGTELAAFLENQPSPSLYRIRRRLLRGDTLTRPVSSYLAEHADELGAAQPIALWLARNGSMSGRIRYAFSQPWNAAVITSTEQEMLYTPQLSVKYLPTPTDTAAIDWTSLYAEAEAMHRSQCTNNPVFVIDDYYAEHVNGGHKHPDVLDEADDRELRDFRAFLDFLRVAHAKPLFILQPLNPYVYENLRELDPVMGTVRDAIRDHGFTCFDMWTSDTSTFRPGTLTDIMHLGPLGWYRVDSALQAYFHVDR